jgi:hypothetical protein
MQGPNPTFVAKFADGVVTRMTTWHAPERTTLDLARGVKLARHAYHSRMGSEAPAITCASFERDGATLATYTADQLARMS